MALADEGATVVFYKGIPQDMAGMILSEEKQAHFKRKCWMLWTFMLKVLLNVLV